MKIQQYRLFSIIIAGILIVLVLFLFAFFERQPSSPRTSPSTPTAPISQSSIPDTATPESNYPSIPPATQEEATPLPTILINNPGNKPALSENDISVEEKILSLLPDGQASGTVYESATVNIKYDSDSDKFVAEILTENIVQAKSEAVNWFENQGMSQQGICDLPVEFSLSLQVQQTTTFSTLPDGCVPYTKSLARTSIPTEFPSQNDIINCDRWDFSKWPDQNPLGNFGDPTCTFTKDKLAQLIKQSDPQHLYDWFNIIEPHEGMYHPNAYMAPTAAMPDSGGSWGLWAMGSAAPPGQLPSIPDYSMNRTDNRGDVPWEIQTKNAIDYNNTVLVPTDCIFWYWQAARDAGIAHPC